jgi:acetyl-CoA carboxylase biotin carboxyl carrier protein
MATNVESEVSGTVWKVEVAVGTSLEEEAPIMVIESMKMEIPVVAPCAGTLVRLLVGEGDSVQQGQVVAEIE